MHFYLTFFLFFRDTARMPLFRTISPVYEISNLNYLEIPSLESIFLLDVHDKQSCLYMPSNRNLRTRTGWKVSSYKHHNWSIVELWRCVAGYFSKCWEPAKYEINFIVSLFYVVSNEDSIYHYSHCPIGSDSWWKYNAATATL